jgi:hypothetical protein
MLRNVFIVLVLAALAATSAAAFPDVPATAHRSAQARIAHPKSAHRPTRKSPRRTSAAHSQAYLRGLRAGHSTSSHGRRPAAPSAHLARTRATQVPPQASVKTASLRRTRYAASPSPLKGSLESLTRQNERTEADGLERILDEDDLAGRIERKLLVPLPESAALTVNPDLAENHRYCRPWTAAFLADLATAHASRFHKPLQVSSAVRTVEYQQQLMRTNGNAAAAEGDVVSPHLTGGTVDIPKQGMSRQELGWMRNWLLARQLSGTIDVEEEFRQSCFHITVYKNYASPSTGPADKTPGHHAVPATQVAADETSDKPSDQ